MNSDDRDPHWMNSFVKNLISAEHNLSYTIFVLLKICKTI